MNELKKEEIAKEEARKLENQQKLKGKNIEVEVEVSKPNENFSLESQEGYFDIYKMFIEIFKYEHHKIPFEHLEENEKKIRMNKEIEYKDFLEELHAEF